MERRRKEWLVPLAGVAFVVLMIIAFTVGGHHPLDLARRVRGGRESGRRAGAPALYDNDFVPIALGAAMFLLGTGAAILQSGVLPKWLGWLMLLLVIPGVTPIGFVSAIGAALLALALGIVLSLRARPPAATAGGPTGAP